MTILASLLFFVIWLIAFIYLGKAKVPANNRSGWYAAFITLFNERKASGKYTIQSLLLTVTLAWVPVSLLGAWDNHNSLSGALPPDLPVYTATGHLFDMRTTKRPVVRFESDDQKSKFLEGRCLEWQSFMLPIERTPVKIEVEGFFLKSGQGCFWFTRAGLQNGNVLLTTQQSMQELNRRRAPAFQLFIPEIMSIPLLLISMINLLWVKQGLKRKIQEI